MNAKRHELIMQRRNVIQHELLPELRNDVGPLTPSFREGHPHSGCFWMSGEGVLQLDKFRRIGR